MSARGRCQVSLSKALVSLPEMQKVGLHKTFNRVIPGSRTRFRYPGYISKFHLDSGMIKRWLSSRRVVVHNAVINYTRYVNSLTLI